jgi:parallel beta-helix repeat protein
MRPIAEIKNQLICASVGVIAALAVAAPAHAAQLHCGSTITKSTKLTQDITNCPGVGLRIGADDITLDLNGHTVAAGAKRNPKAHGILNEGHDRVTITGGTVRGFGAYGVRLSHADRNVVHDMRMTANWTGIGLFESDRGVVADNVMTDSKFVGANLTGGKRNRIAGNEIADTRGAGVFVHSSPDEPGTRHVVARNELSGNGIQILAGPQRTRVTANAVTAARGDGIGTFEPSTVLAGNAVVASLLQGIYAPNGATDRGGNTASDNAIDPQCEGVVCS